MDNQCRICQKEYFRYGNESFKYQMRSYVKERGVCVLHDSKKDVEWHSQESYRKLFWHFARLKVLNPTQLEDGTKLIDFSQGCFPKLEVVSDSNDFRRDEQGKITQWNIHHQFWISGQASTFPHQVIFDDSIFIDTADFDSVYFHNKTSFKNVRFKKATNFKQATFIGDVDFEGAVFYEDFEFDRTTTVKKQIFLASAYKKGFKLNGVTFPQGMISNTHTTFTRKAKIDACRFDQTVDLSNSIFRNGLSVSNCNAKDWLMRHCTFDGGVIFKENPAIEVLDCSSSTFKRFFESRNNRFSTQLNLAESEFESDFSIDHAQTKDPVAILIDVSKSLFLGDFKVSNLQQLNRMDLSECQFENKESAHPTSCKFTAVRTGVILLHAVKCFKDIDIKNIEGPLEIMHGTVLSNVCIDQIQSFLTVKGSIIRKLIMKKVHGEASFLSCSIDVFKVLDFNERHFRCANSTINYMFLRSIVVTDHFDLKNMKIGLLKLGRITLGEHSTLNWSNIRINKLIIISLFIRAKEAYFHNVQIQTKLYIGFSQFKNTVFNILRLDGGESTINIHNTLLEDTKLNNIFWGKRSLKNFVASRDVFRQLKTLNRQQGNVLDANMFHSLEMDRYRKELFEETKWNEKIEDKVLFGISKWMSDYSRSWVRPFFYFMVFSIVFYIWSHFYLGCLIQEELSVDGFARFLNPFNKSANEDGGTYTDNLTYTIWLVHKIISAIFIYHIVVALKRQTKQ